MKSAQISLAELKNALHYDPETGVFTWINHSQRTKYVGKAAGSVNKIGYRYIRVMHGVYLAHRLAIYYMTGTYPDQVVDHINGNPSDNRFDNLRVVRQAVNCQNRTQPRKGSSSGVLGVHKKSRNAVKPWTAAIMLNRKKHHLGCFSTKAEAHAAYVAAKREMHEGGRL